MRFNHANLICCENGLLAGGRIYYSQDTGLCAAQELQANGFKPFQYRWTCGSKQGLSTLWVTRQADAEQLVDFWTNCDWQYALVIPPPAPWSDYSI
jgi:hypothetical protein